MTTPDAPTSELAAFDPPLARAVVTVLRSSGVPAVLGDEAAGEAAVLVPAERRQEAFAVLAARMDEVHTETGGLRAAAPGTGAPAPAPEGAEEADRPLVLERFRRFGWLAVALVPLLVITLANVRLPASVMTAIIVGCVLVASAWRSGRFGER